jgi:hypothetical protein
MNFWSSNQNLEIHFFWNHFQIRLLKRYTHPRFAHSESRTRQTGRPAGDSVPTRQRERERQHRFHGISPTARSPVTRSPPPWPLCQGGHVGASSEAEGAPKEARHHQWRSNGAAPWRWAVSSQARARGRAHWLGEAVWCWCAQKRSKGWSGGASSMEQCALVSTGRTPASNFSSVRAYHDVPKRATGVRWRSGARGVV